MFDMVTIIIEYHYSEYIFENVITVFECYYENIIRVKKYLYFTKNMTHILVYVMLKSYNLSYYYYY